MSKIHTTVILAMSVDGKITDFQSSPARFGSINDKNHLEKQVSLSDCVIFGANTLRSYGTSLPITNNILLQEREKQNKPLQPIHIVVSNSGKIDPTLRFFSQNIPRWLVTSEKGLHFWDSEHNNHFHNNYFHKILILNDNWEEILEQLNNFGLKKIAILGGGELVYSLLKLNLIDEFWLTISPLILGGKNAPSPVGGKGFLQEFSPRLKLVNMKNIGDELFLNYRVRGRG